MSFRTLYRLSNYAMLVLATLILSVDAVDYSRYALMYPIAVAVAAVAAFLLVDRGGSAGLPRDVANFLGLGTLVLAILEYASNPDAMVLTMGHWLVYLQIVKFFHPKHVEDDWYLFLLGLVQVLIGTFLSQSGHVGLLLFCYALISLWNFGLFHLKRESERKREAAGVTITPVADPLRPYPGLLNPGFFATTFAVAAASLLLGSAIFYMIPRWGEASALGPVGKGRPLTGFSEDVRLGQMGEILENDQLVMSIELLNANGDIAELDVSDLLLRGVTLVRYQDGRWSRGFRSDRSVRSLDFPEVAAPDRIRQRIILESTSSGNLFASGPILDLRVPTPDEIEFSETDAALAYRPESEENRGARDATSKRRAGLRYEVITTPPGPIRVQRHEMYPLDWMRREMLEIPDALRPTLSSFNAAVLEGKEANTREEIGRALERHLRDSGQFFYSLKMERTDLSLDPVADFLVNRKEGHCEYYASALALLLRERGIPTRIVNGFKGGDWNGLVRSLNVREKHAHSWVEALLGRDPAGRPRWLVLDPTPSRERDRVAARVGNTLGPVRTATDAAYFLWTHYIAGFDQERQNRLVYDRIRELGAAGRELVMNLDRVLATIANWLFRFRQPGEFFSVRGFVVSVTFMLLAALVTRLLVWIVRKLLARRRGVQVRHGASSPEVAFFQRLIRLLSESGLERGEAETPLEFARRASTFLRSLPAGLASAESGPDVALVPEAVVDAFYSVRFGRHDLAPERIEQVARGLDALEARRLPGTTG